MNPLSEKSVLIVDDDRAMLRALTKVLASEGCRVTSVDGPVAALGELSNREKRFDLLIADLRMPVLSGRGVLSFATATVPEMPVIIITAFGSPETKAEALSLGAFDFLEKPIYAGQLEEAVNRALVRTATGAGSKGNPTKQQTD